MSNPIYFGKKKKKKKKKKKTRKKLDKVPRGAHIPRPALPPLFKEHKVCSFDSGDGSCMLYVITLKKFNHTYEALDLKGQAQVQGLS